MNKVIVAGGRDINNYELIEKTMRESGFKIDELVCGMCSGVDGTAKMVCELQGIPVKEFWADWDLGKVGGPIRNEKMAKYATHLILIWDGKSKGSFSMKNLAKQYGLTIFEKIV